MRMLERSCEVDDDLHQLPKEGSDMWDDIVLLQNNIEVDIKVSYVLLQSVLDSGINDLCTACFSLPTAQPCLHRLLHLYTHAGPH